MSKINTYLWAYQNSQPLHVLTEQKVYFYSYVKKNEGSVIIPYANIIS